VKHGGKETSAPGETLLNGSSALDVRLARVPPLTLVMEGLSCCTVDVRGVGGVFTKVVGLWFFVGSGRERLVYRFLTRFSLWKLREINRAIVEKGER